MTLLLHRKAFWQLRRPPTYPLVDEIAALIIGLGAVLLTLVGCGAAAFALSGSSLGFDSSALASVDLDALGGSIAQVHATGPGGKPIPIAVHGGQLVPQQPLAPGERVSLEVTVERPAAIGWLVGGEQTKQLTVTAPSARVRNRWLTVKPSSPPRVRFDRPVRAVAYGTPGHLHHRHFQHPRTSVSLGTGATAGTALVAGVPRTWESLGKPQSVTWLPKGDSPTVSASPAPGAEITPATPLRLTFSKPCSGYSARASRS